MGKASIDRKIREAALPLLQPDEAVEVAFVAQVGIGQWPLLLYAAAIAFLIAIFVPDSLGQSIAMASVFGVAVLVWFVVAPAHGVALTARRVLLFPLTFGGRVKSAPIEMPREAVRSDGPLSGWGWLKLILQRRNERSIRLNIASSWRREAESLRVALLPGVGRPAPNE